MKTRPQHFFPLLLTYILSIKTINIYSCHLKGLWRPVEISFSVSLLSAPAEGLIYCKTGNKPTLVTWGQTIHTGK